MKDNIDLVEVALLIHPLPVGDQKTLPKGKKTISSNKVLNSSLLDKMAVKEKK